MGCAAPPPSFRRAIHQPDSQLNTSAEAAPAKPKKLATSLLSAMVS
jgi:hypothetical protein